MKMFLFHQILFCAADGLGIKNLLPAFRDPMLSNDELPTGVCFASGGSGLDRGTYGFQVNLLILFTL